MKFGLFFLGERPPNVSDREVYSNALEQARVAEELGFDAVWLAEHHFAPYGTIPDTLTFAAAVAATTNRIRIGTGVIVPTFHHPVLLAEQIAMVDVLSGGRFDVGLGRGYQGREFKALGIPQEGSRARFEEAVAIIDGLLRNEHFSYTGAHWTVDDVTVYPRPVQRPAPPIYVAVIRSPESFRYVAQHGYGALLGNPYQIDPELNEGLQGYRRAMKEYAGDAAENNVWVLTNGFVHEDAKFALEFPRQSVELGIQYVLDYSKPFEDGDAIPEDYRHYADWFERGRRVDYDRMVNLDSSLFGSPEMVTERIIQMNRKAGWRNFIVCLNRGGWMSQSEVLKAMELFAKRVIPAVQAETARAERSGA